METTDKPLAWLHGEVKTPPFSALARIEAGGLLRQLQMGVALGMPHSDRCQALAAGVMNYVCWIEEWLGAWCTEG